MAKLLNLNLNYPALYVKLTGTECA